MEEKKRRRPVLRSAVRVPPPLPLLPLEHHVQGRSGIWQYSFPPWEHHHRGVLSILQHCFGQKPVEPFVFGDAELDLGNTPPPLFSHLGPH